MMKLALAIVLSLQVTILEAKQTTDGCTNGDIQLVDGISEYDGTVQMCVNGTFEVVCGDDWSQNETRAVCRQLGFLQQQEYSFTKVNRTSNISRNPLQNSSNCEYQVQVACAPSKHCPGSETTVRLVGGNTTSEGRVEMCIKNFWKEACCENWGEAETNTTCRQLNFSSGHAFYFGDRTGPVSTCRLDCENQQQESLQKCMTATPCNCTNQSARVICQDDTSSTFATSSEKVSTGDLTKIISSTSEDDTSSTSSEEVSTGDLTKIISSTSEVISTNSWSETSTKSLSEIQSTPPETPERKERGYSVEGVVFLVLGIILITISIGIITITATVLYKKAKKKVEQTASHFQNESHEDEEIAEVGNTIYGSYSEEDILGIVEDKMFNFNNPTYETIYDLNAKATEVEMTPPHSEKFDDTIYIT